MMQTAVLCLRGTEIFSILGTPGTALPVAEYQPYRRIKTGLLSRYPLRENKGNLVRWFAEFMQVAYKLEGILHKFPPSKRITVARLALSAIGPQVRSTIPCLLYGPQVGSAPQSFLSLP